MRGVRVPLILLALALLLVAAAVAWAQEGPDPAAPPPPDATATPSPLVTPPPTDPLPEEEPAEEQESDIGSIDFRRSQALGLHYFGRLRNGVQLSPEGNDYVTWDPVLKRSPNRPWRRWGTDQLVLTLLEVVEEYAAAHPDAPRLVVGDLSRPQGGNFGKRFGGLGHASHQNGLDVDVYWPRKDGLERAPRRPEQVDLALSQDLLDRFSRRGAIKLFIGPRLALKRKRRSVVPLVHHDDHLHVRLPNHRR
jgi:murein endopeptidase